MKTFEVGKTYRHGWAGDAELFSFWTVIARTKSTITIKDGDEVRKCRIMRDSEEFFKAEAVRPYGSYSMSPILVAENIA